jgi:capsular polysaccharide biosynthesis protein
MNQSKMVTDLEKRQEGKQFSVMDQPNLLDAPFFPKRSAFVLGGIVGCLAMGLLIVALIEYKDTSLRMERGIWAFTKFPTLAVILNSGYIAIDRSVDTSDRFPRLSGRQKSTIVQAWG